MERRMVLPVFELVGSQGEVAFRADADHPATVGRAGTTTEMTVADSSISRHHAKLKRTAEGLAIEDLGSTNGTFLNDERVTTAIAKDGDVVKFGNVAFQVRRARAVEPSPDDPADAILDETISDRGILRAMPVNVTSFGALLEGQRKPSPLAAADATRENRLRRLELLLEVARKFSQNVSLEELLENVVDVTCRILDVHRVSIVLVDPGSKELKPLISRHRDRSAGDAVRLPASILRTVVRDKVAVRTDNALADARFGGQSIVLQNVCGAMCTPLLSSAGEVTGAIYVDNLTPLGSYTDEDLDFLVSFGGIAGAALENSRLSQALRSKAVILSNFERYFAPDLAAAIAGEQAQIQVGGAKRPVAILFSDICGFTPLSERMGPEELVKLLNGYFSEMVDIVFEHGGTLDKFIGDAIMANWGAPLAHADDADRALQAAIEMQRELKLMNARRGAADPAIEVKIGINYGAVFVGNIGSHRRLEYTVIGDPVNVASRLCASAGPGHIIISESLYQALSEKPQVEARPPVQLRGRAEATATYRVLW
jgi:adenylate cyclase